MGKVRVAGWGGGLSTGPSQIRVLHGSVWTQCGLRHRLDLRLEGWRMRFGMSMKVSLPDKRTVSGWGRKRGQKLGGVSGQPHWSVLAFFGPVAFLQEQRRAEVRVRLGGGEQRAGACGGARTRQERCLVFWEPALQRQRLCQILRSRQKRSEQAANELVSIDVLKQRRHLGAIGLEWRGRSPSRCGRRCGR